jgi:hypothetical protein
VRRGSTYSNLFCLFKRAALSLSQLGETSSDLWVLSEPIAVRIIRCFHFGDNSAWALNCCRNIVYSVFPRYLLTCKYISRTGVSPPFRNFSWCMRSKSRVLLLRTIIGSGSRTTTLRSLFEPSIWIDQIVIYNYHQVIFWSRLCAVTVGQLVSFPAASNSLGTIQSGSRGQNFILAAQLRLFGNGQPLLRPKFSNPGQKLEDTVPPAPPTRGTGIAHCCLNTWLPK